jgi:hypothetical protein
LVIFVGDISDKTGTISGIVQLQNSVRRKGGGIDGTTKPDFSVTS